MYKTDALKSLRRLIHIWIFVQIRVKVTEENLKEPLADAQIVYEAFDNPEAKAQACKWNSGYSEKKLVSVT